MMTKMTSSVASRAIRDEPEREGAIVEEWSQWLYKTHGAGLPTLVLDVIWGQAWEYGHSAGLSEVETYFTDLVEMTERVLTVR